MEQQNYRAIFFDLDGTLLPLDVNAFLEGYFKQLGAFCAEAGLDPDKTIKAVMGGTHHMTQAPCDGRTNAEHFWDYVAQLGFARDKYEPLFLRFYDTNFRHLGDDVVPNPAAARAIAACKAKGYPLFLTTMPLFPLPAVEHRVEWAGVDPSAFARITTYDNSTATKPHLDYYRENVALAGVEAAEVLMVGNNTREDLAAMQIGCDAYLVTDLLLDPDSYDYSQVKHSSLEGFADWCENVLPACTNPAPLAKGEGLPNTKEGR